MNQGCHLAQLVPDRRRRAGGPGAGRRRDLLRRHPGRPAGRSIIAALPVRLRAELVWYVEQRLVLDIGGDEPGAFTLHLRRGVLEVLDGAVGDADATIQFTDKAALVAYLTGTALDQLVATSRVKIDGDREVVARFGTYLDSPPDASRIMVTLHGPAR